MRRNQRTFSFFSIFLVAVLLALVVGKLFTQEAVDVESYIRRAEVDDCLIVRFVVTNNEEGELNYTCYFYIDDELERTHAFDLASQEQFIFGANINITRRQVNKVRFIVYDGGSSEPIHETVHYVD